MPVQTGFLTKVIGMRVFILSLLAASAAAFAPSLMAPGLRSAPSMSRARPACLALDMKVAVFGASGLTGAEVAYQVRMGECR